MQSLGARKESKDPSTVENIGELDLINQQVPQCIIEYDRTHKFSRLIVEVPLWYIQGRTQGLNTHFAVRKNASLRTRKEPQGKPKKT